MMQQFKGKTSYKLQQQFPQLRKRYWGQHLWARGYFAVSSGNVTDEMWMDYISNQEERQDPNAFGDFQISR
jgi:putative transposase